MLDQCNFSGFLFVSRERCVGVDVKNLLVYQRNQFLFLMRNSDMHFFQIIDYGRINEFQGNTLHVVSDCLGVGGITKHTFKSRNVFLLFLSNFIVPGYVIISF